MLELSKDFQNLQLGPIPLYREGVPRLNYSKWPPLAEWTQRTDNKGNQSFVIFFITDVSEDPCYLVQKLQRIPFG